MDPRAFRIIERKKRGEALTGDEVGELVAGAASGEWGDAEVAAFLMAAAIQGLDVAETGHLTRAMLESGERWDLDQEIPQLADKHSTGGVGDKVSLLLAPLLAACDLPVVMLTGRALGHTGGTADKLESIPGIGLDLDRDLCLKALRRTGLAIGIPTGAIAPADGRIYGLRDRTATIDSLPLITGSILSKKLATGASALVFDVKTGDGAFMSELADARALARMLVDTAAAVGKNVRALLTDMSQPLGRWVGHLAEVREVYDCFAGDGPGDLLEVTYALCEELSEMTGAGLSPSDFDAAITSGQAREKFEAWAALQGADPAWLRAPSFPLAPEEVVLTARRPGRLARVQNRRLGELMVRAGSGRATAADTIDYGVALNLRCRLGDAVDAGDELARLHLRRRDDALVQAFEDCFVIGDEGEAPKLLLGRVE